MSESLLGRAVPGSLVPGSSEGRPFAICPPLSMDLSLSIDYRTCPLMSMDLALSMDVLPPCPPFSMDLSLSMNVQIPCPPISMDLSISMDVSTTPVSWNCVTGPPVLAPAGPDEKLVCIVF